MKLFTVHAAPGPTIIEGAESARATRTGFSFTALVFGPLWLLARGLWLEFLVYAILAAAVGALFAYAGLRPGGVVALFVLARLYLAVEGRALAAAARSRAGRPIVDLIFARNTLEAEKVYLERALAVAPAAYPRVGLRADEGVIGVFPEPRR